VRKVHTEGVKVQPVHDHRAIGMPFGHGAGG
jgi:hypothetical protein